MWWSMARAVWVLSDREGWVRAAGSKEKNASEGEKKAEGRKAVKKLLGRAQILQLSANDHDSRRVDTIKPGPSTI
jgi:hypothetical protein